MKLCKKCGTDIPNIIKIDGKSHNISARVYCLECSPFGKHNTQDLTIKKSDVKHCIRCQTDKPLSEFYQRRTRPGVTSYCKQCQIDQSSERQQAHKKECIDYKGGKCQICGFNSHPAALQFHHRDPSQKELSIASCKSTKFNEETRLELDKCDLVCANCHSIIHSKN